MKSKLAIWALIISFFPIAVFILDQIPVIKEFFDLLSLGVFSLNFFLYIISIILSVIFSDMSLIKIKKSPELGGKGLAIAGLIICGIYILIFLVILFFTIFIGYP